MNLHEQDPECDLDFVPNQARKCNVKVAMNNAYAFGGNNSSLLFFVIVITLGNVPSNLSIITGNKPTGKLKSNFRSNHGVCVIMSCVC